MEIEMALGGAHSAYDTPHNQVRSSRGMRREASRRRGRNLMRSLLWLAYVALLLAMLAFGWINRNEKHWVPETGVGYWLGIAGATAMLLLLVYPLCKRFRSLRFLGSVPVWFRLHMAFGLLGPTLILLHCNFKSTSINASVALSAMLTVAASGLVGRFLYGHVHSKLSGRRLAASSIFEESVVGNELSRGDSLFQLSQQTLDQVAVLTKAALKQPRGIAAALGHAWLVRWQVHQMTRLLRREIRALNRELLLRKAAPRRQLREARIDFENDVGAHLAATSRAATLTIHERLFSLWHFLHLPLFLMLVIAAIVHVIAVHLY